MRKEPNLNDLLKLFKGHEHKYLLIGLILEVDADVLVLL